MLLIDVPTGWIPMLRTPLGCDYTMDWGRRYMIHPVERQVCRDIVGRFGCGLDSSWARLPHVSLAVIAFASFVDKIRHFFIPNSIYIYTSKTHDHSTVLPWLFTPNCLRFFMLCRDRLNNRYTYKEIFLCVEIIRVYEVPCKIYKY